MFHGARALPERGRVLVDARERAAAGHEEDLRERRDRLRRALDTSASTASSGSSARKSAVQ